MIITTSMIKKAVSMFGDMEPKQIEKFVRLLNEEQGGPVLTYTPSAATK